MPNKVEKVVLDLYSKNPTLTLREGVEKLSKKFIKISHETISRYLRAINIKFRSILLKAFLTEQHVAKRLVSAQANLNRE